MKKLFIYLSAAILFLTACKKDKDNGPPLSIEPVDIFLEHTSGECTIKINASSTWSVGTTADWITSVTPKSGVAGENSLSVSYKENALNNWRDGEIVLRGPQGSTAVLKLTQGVSQRGALMAIYKATDGDNWKANWEWGTKSALSTWARVVTDGKENVIGLSLGDNNLRGALPREIGSLKALKRLELWHNKLTNIPKELGLLTALTYLDFQDNASSIENALIPEEIWQLNNLTYLDFAFNNLKGTIPTGIGNLTKLTYLDLEKNRLEGEIPKELGLLTQLKDLYLNYNVLTGTVPKEIGQLTQLTKLRLNHNNLKTLPPEIGGLILLEFLALQNNLLEGEIPKEIGNLTKLKDLYLNNNNFTGNIPVEFKNLKSISNAITLNGKSLFSFNVSENRLSGNVPPEVKALSWWTSYSSWTFGALNPQQSGYGLVY